jgi:phage/plasmid-like protein (TIGR03299 family)
MPANVESMFSVREEPWHGLGTIVQECLTAEEALKEAGLQWTVEKFPAFAHIKAPASEAFPTGYEDFHPIPDRFSTVRVEVTPEGTEFIPFGTVGRLYTPIQNHEVAAFGDVLLTTGNAKYETAGSLGRGENIWFLSKLPEQIRVKGTDDITNLFLLLTNCHDGSRVMRVLLTPVRVVCQNTLNAALSGSDNIFTIRHLPNYAGQVEQARKILGLSTEYFTELGELADFLVGIQFGEKQVNQLAAALFPFPEDISEAERAYKIACDARNKLSRLFSDSPTCTLPGIKGTAWAAYNAAVEYFDWELDYRGESQTLQAERRFEANAFQTGGRCQRQKQEALQLVRSLSSA